MKKQFKFHKVMGLSEQDKGIKHVILDDDGIIEKISAEETEGADKYDFSNCIAIPGFIDAHIHGIKGCDVMDATREALEEISLHLASEGITRFLATTVTASLKDTRETIEKLGKILKEDLKGAKCIGIYLEGPFLSAKRRGAHEEQHLMAPDIQYMEELIALSDHQIKVVAIAPELEGSEAFIKHFSKKGIKIALGHSDADFITTKRAIKAGASIAIHLFNGMRPIHHREGGIVLASLLSEVMYTEMIADHIHLSKETLLLIDEMKGKKCYCVSDCMAATGLKDGVYQLGKQEVAVENKKARTPSGSLAGSTTTLYNSFQLLKETYNKTPEDMIAYFTKNVANAIGAEKIGAIKEGNKGDFIVVDNAFNIIATIVQGKVVYERKGF